MLTSKSLNAGCFSAILLLATALSSLADAGVFTWEGDESSDLVAGGNWVGGTAPDFVAGNEQLIFGASLGSTTPQLATLSDGGKITWLSQTASGAVTTGLLFDVGAPAYTFGDGGDAARSLGLYTDSNPTGSTNIVNLSGNTQTFNVLVRTRIGGIDAANGDIVFNNGFRPGDAVNDSALYAAFQGDDNIYLNGPVTGYTGTGANRSRIFYDGASTTAENAGKLILGDIGTAYRGKIVVSSQKGGAVVATSNNSFGDPTFVSSGLRDTYIGGTGNSGNVSNGVVEIDGTAGDLTIAENFRVETRTLSNGAPHIRNVAGNNTISGYVITAFDGGIATAGDAFILESAGGTLRFSGSIGQDLANKTVNLYLQGGSNGEIAASSTDNLGISEDLTGSIFHVTKRGNGTWTTLTGAVNRYAGTTTIEAGKYFMNGTHTTSGPTGAGTASGVYTVNSGATLGGSGTIGPAVSAAGILSPGSAVSTVGTLTVGELSLTGATLSFDLNSLDDTPGGATNDLIITTGALNLSGGATLNVAGIGGALTAGDYDLIQFGGVLTGTFSDITLGTILLEPGLSASIVIDANSVNLHVASPTTPGDFDGDGDVDGADFIAWQTNFPTTSGASQSQGDSDQDGDVDGADFAAWQSSFPNPSGPGTSPVPEPMSIVLALIAFSGGLVFRRRAM